MKPCNRDLLFVPGSRARSHFAQKLKRFTKTLNFEWFVDCSSGCTGVYVYDFFSGSRDRLSVIYDIEEYLCRRGQAADIIVGVPGVEATGLLINIQRCVVGGLGYFNVRCPATELLIRFDAVF